MLDGIIFQHPWFLLGLIIIPVLVVWYIFSGRKNKPTLQFSNITFFKGIRRTFRQRMYPILFILRILAIAAVIIALARPQSKLSRQEMNIEGVDIILALDISGSMLAEDFKPNRLIAAKQVAEKFIDGRPNDRIGLVIFSGEAFTQCPLTIDHDVLKSLLEKVESGMIEDGTAIGDGLGTAINRIKDSKAVSKIIILLTDGVNNAGYSDPQSVAKMTAEYGIRLYTIGVGKKGMAPYPFRTPFGVQYDYIPVEIDEPVMRQMAEVSNGGTYFRATDGKSLQTIFDEINSMEKSKIDVTKYDQTKDEFFIILLIALLCFTLEVLLRQVYFRTIP